jgi:hypothetical protein
MHSSHRLDRVRQLFEAVDRSIETGEWVNPEFDSLLSELEGAIADAYGPQSSSGSYPPGERTVLGRAKAAK